MEGLIPFIIRSVRKQKLYNSYRCLSDGSTRSYHLLAGGDSFHGSSRSRTQLESPPLPAAAAEQPYGFDAVQSRGANKGFMLSGAVAANAGLQLTSSYYPQINKDVANASAVHHRRHEW